jgi:hypothetical protein
MTVHRFFDEIAQRELVIDPAIPGQIGWESLVGLARCATMVPKGGTIVEVGALFGRSSYIWAMNTDPTTKVFCIDPWERVHWIVEVVEKPQNAALPFSAAAHAYYTRECPNIIRIKGYSPQVVEDWWTDPIDLYFEDSDHEEAALSRNFNFWVPRIKPGGILCGDEYAPEYPATLAKIRTYEKLWNTKAVTTGLFWWMRKPE